MKILLINNHHKYDGGTEKYYLTLSELLKSKGHEIAYFSMHDPMNLKTPWEKYFVSNLNFNKRGFVNSIKILLRMSYSLESISKLNKLLRDFKPDIAHINNIYYYLSPSILGVLRRHGIPIVQTIHDYQIISPNPILFSNGKVCENTKVHRYYMAFLKKSISNSFLASFMAVFSSYTQYLCKFYEKNVDVFITPSRFIKNKLKEYNFAGSRIVLLPNFITKQKKQKNIPQNKYILFFGKLSEQKGIYPILKLAEDIPQINIVMMGKFESKKTEIDVKKQIKDKHLNITLKKYTTNNSLQKTITGSKFVLVPSIWYENQPYSIMEASSLGKAVVASRIGGIPEVVKHLKTGLLFNYLSYDDFKKEVNMLLNNDKLARKMGKDAKKNVENVYSADKYYDKLIKIYSYAINKKNYKKIR